MTSKKPFRLSLKLKGNTSSADDDANTRRTSSAYMHPLAGQQNLLRTQLSPQEAGPSKGSIPSAKKKQVPDTLNEMEEKKWEEQYESAEDPRRERDLDTMSATEGWFNSRSPDEESLRSSPGVSESVFDGQSSLFASVQEAFQKQQLDEQETSQSSFSVTRIPNQHSAATHSSEERQAEALHSAQDSRTAVLSPSRESGILNRLKRISKKEKTQHLREPTSMLLDLEPASSDDLTSEYSSTLAQVSSEAKDDGIDLNLTLRDAAKEMTPHLERRHRESIQSVQPSLVDDESIAGRESPPTSPLTYDDDDFEVDYLQQSTSDDRHKAPSIHSVYGLIDSMVPEEEGEDGIESEWPTVDVPGSFFLDRNPTLPDTSSAYRSPTLYSDDSPRMFASPVLEIQPSTPPESVFHERNLSAYSDALSRQSSDFSVAHDRLATGVSEGALAEEDGEEAVTPRANEDTRGSYFDTLPAATPPRLETRSVSSFNTVSTPTKAMPSKTYTWFGEARLDERQRHYFLQHVMVRELIWEIQRLFLLEDMRRLYQPTPVQPKTDLTYLKDEAVGTIPNLPLMRFLYTNLFSTCPLFGPAQPIEGAAAIQARKVGAKKFFDEGILPWLRFRHKCSLAHATDLNGEWPHEVFDSPSTTGVLLGSLFTILPRLMMAALPHKRSEAWNWTAIAPPSSAAYLAHRVAPSKLKQGGMEVNIVGARVRSSAECELLVSVRRFGFPPCYVVRTESDFYEYARGLAEELGRRTRIRPVPAPIGYELVSFTSPPNGQQQQSRSVSGAGESPKKINQREIFYQKNTSQNSLSSGPATPSRREPKRVPSSESLTRLPRSNRSSVSIGSGSSTPSNEVTAQQGSAALKPPASDKPRFFYRTKVQDGGNASLASLMTGSNTTISNPSGSSPLPHPARDEELRRKQLRAWLRDVLSVRGAGHANETRQFLSNGSFLEKEVRTATKKDIQRREEIDSQSIKEREISLMNAPDEIVDLHREMAGLWQDCVEGDGFLRAYEAVKHHDTFSSLPLTYQRQVSWANLQFARFLHHTFLISHEARSNFERATELMQCLPWKIISLALREPTGLMIQKLKSSFAQEFILKKILALQLEDVPAKKVNLELASLRKRLGSTICRKLEGFVEGAEWQKQVIRKAAKRNNIPLVCAIVRGDDKPLLAAEGVKRIVAATKIFQEFLATQPSYEAVRAKVKANVDVRLIHDMQRSLRLYSLRHNGQKIRAGLTSELRAPVQALLEPLFSLLKRLHRSKILTRPSPPASSFGGAPGMGGSNATGGGGGGSSSSSSSNAGLESDDIVMELQRFIFRLFDVLAGLKMRVQDPWRSLSTLTLFLDDVVPSWYRFVHRLAHADGLLYDLTLWLKSFAALLRTKSAVPMEEVAKHWQPPKGGLSQSDIDVVSELTNMAKQSRSHDMEAACRWAAGDIDADHSIQLMGEAGKTRVTPYHLPSGRAPSSKSTVALDVYLLGLRSALSKFM